MMNNAYADGKDTFDNLGARHLIDNTLSTPEEKVLALQMYGFAKYRIEQDGASFIDFNAHRRFCRDMNISECSYINDQTFNMIYHLVYPGELSPADRWKEYYRSRLGDGFYMIKDGEYEPVVDAIINAFSTNASLKEMYERGRDYGNSSSGSDMESEIVNDTRNEGYTAVDSNDVLFENDSEASTDKATDDMNHSIIFATKKGEYEFIRKSEHSDFTKYDFEVLVQITEQFLGGEKSIEMLAEEYEVAKCVICTWIIFCYSETQNIMGVRGRVVEEYNYMQPYEDDFKRLVSKINAISNMKQQCATKLLGISNESWHVWRNKYGDCDIDDINLDNVIVDLFLRKKLAKVEKENRVLKRKIDANLLEGESEYDE